MIAVLLLSGCHSASEAAAVPSFSPTPSATSVPEPKVIADMDAEALPETYLEAMENGGTVESITYSALNYTDGDGSTLSKEAEVYLPSGYSDSSDSYPLIILMHGWQGNGSTIFTAEDGAVVNVMDHMISDGMIPACIVVTPTFDTRNKSASWEKSETELEPFAQETRNDLLPYLLENYRISSDRNDHYFGGFSMGGVTTWYEFLENLDLFHGFLSLSGDCWKTKTDGAETDYAAVAELLAQAVSDQGYTSSDFVIVAESGSDDYFLTPMEEQVTEMRKTDTFTEENLFWRLQQGASHSYGALGCYLYNGLPILFGTSDQKR